ncbi:uncharacterized protein NEMAJ01_1326 [Nematocida major]|uniref:uncharacterized protein n=1 Tax=Nematocida major TaxID=1912982 RepID=UPI0020080070|nr:uncharacterized protein NEMAJ01_1326 [Nematocida major]KAH9386430.1 hypothetical protein NEMAJ01_1326 [Nematocida major]
MNLLPIKARASEGPSHTCELFFIDRTLFSPEYFFLNVLPLIPGVEKEESGPLSGASSARAYAEVASQIKKYTTYIEKFTALYKDAKVNVAIDFQVATFLHITDKVSFRLPIKTEPDIYAKDIFRTYSVPEGELLNIFIFYVRESILSALKAAVRAPALEIEDNFQQTEPTVQVANIHTLNQRLLSYETMGRVTVLSDAPERKRRKKKAPTQEPFEKRAS